LRPPRLLAIAPVIFATAASRSQVTRVAIFPTAKISITDDPHHLKHTGYECDKFDTTGKSPLLIFRINVKPRNQKYFA